MKFLKLFLTLSFLASILGMTDSAYALTFNLSGRFSNKSSCNVEGPPNPARCNIQRLEDGSFTGAINLDEFGQILPSPTFIDVTFFDKAGQEVGIYGSNFIRGNITTNQQSANLSLSTIIPPSVYDELNLSFSPISGLNEPFGAFLNGSYSKQEGIGFRISERIDVILATVTLANPPVSIPEASAVPGIFAIFIACSLWRAPIFKQKH